MAEWATIWDQKVAEAQERQTKILEQQNDILIGQGRALERQSKILEDQKVFTKVLAFATLLLGLVAFFSFFNIEISINEFFGETISSKRSNTIHSNLRSVIIIIKI